MEAESTNSVDVRANGPFAMLYRIADGIALVAAFLAAACILALTGLILTEILFAFLARFVTGMPSSIGIGWEYSAYLMGGSFMLGAGMTLRAGRQIRVEILLWLKDRKFARFCELASSLVGLSVAVFLAITMSQLTVRMFMSGEASQSSFTPLWIPQSVLTAGTIILALQMVIRTLACLLDYPVDRPELGAATQVE